MKKNEICEEMALLKEQLSRLILNGGEKSIIYKTSVKLDDLINYYYYNDDKLKKIS